MNNIERSEVVIARIIELLAEWGIQDSELAFSELRLDEEFEPFFSSSLIWLADEGVIRYRKLYEMGQGEDSFATYPVLTSRGFALMNNKITLGDEELPIKDAVSQVSKSGGNHASLGDFFGGLLGGFTKSMGS